MLFSNSLTKILDSLTILIIEDEPKCVHNPVRAHTLQAQNQTDIQLANEYLLKGDKKKAAELYRDLSKNDANVPLMDRVAVEYKLAAAVESVSDGIEFLSSPHEIDLIISDIQIHEGLGIEILRHTEVNIPVIFCTAFDKYNLERSAGDCLQYILKPFTAETVKSVIEAMASCSNLRPRNRMKSFTNTWTVSKN